MARLAAELRGTEIALITLVDADYQWFKARIGQSMDALAAALRAAVAQAPSGA